MSGPRIPRPWGRPQQSAAGTCRLAAVSADKVREAMNDAGVEPDGGWPRCSANAGTVDPNMIPLLRGAVRIGELASEPTHHRAGYIEGFHHGSIYGAIAGLMLGSGLVFGALQLGLLAGGVR